MEYSKCICDFSLILIIYLFLAFPKQMNPFSHSILGRTLAVLLIVYYAYQDVLYGLLFCIIVVYYYYRNESNLHEGFLWEYQLETGKTDDFYNIPNNTTQYQSFVETPYQYTRTGNEATFVEQNCPNGNLTKKGGPSGEFRVNPEMSEHAFTELSFSEQPCNPCSKQCAFSASIVDKRLKTEEEIIVPKNSNEWFDTIMARINP
jgi:hypothetical protein